MMKSLLLHVCCGICAQSVFETLDTEDFSITGFFYNPNIDTREEYARRRDTAWRCFKERGFDFYAEEYDPRAFEEAIGSTVQTPDRCRACWRMRLARSADAAVHRGAAFFSTTLLSSPYQDIRAIADIAGDVSAANVSHPRFVAENFRRGFQAAYAHAKAGQWYIQHYCGCRYSEQDSRSLRAHHTSTR